MRKPAQPPAHSDVHGYAMAVLLVGLAVMLTLMTVAMPVWRQQQKREREEELLFRLKQYAHALALYQRRLPGAAPASLDDLVKERFLRRKYKDPMTGKDFAILRVGQVSPGMTSPLPGGIGGGPLTSGAPGQPTGRPSTQGQGQGPGTGSSFGPANPSSQRLPGSPSTVGGSTGAIRGVVSTSKDTSLRAWKGRTQYDQWEVSIEDVTPRFFGAQTPQPGQNPRQGPGQSRPGQMGPGPASPRQMPTNPYGGTVRP